MRAILVMYRNPTIFFTFILLLISFDSFAFGHNTISDFTQRSCLASNPYSNDEEKILSDTKGVVNYNPNATYCLPAGRLVGLTNPETRSITCVANSNNPSYVDPYIVMKSRTCFAGTCNCDWVKLAPNKCDWMLINLVLQRVCARTIGAKARLKTRESMNTGKDDWGNDSNIAKICGFIDSCDAGDSSGCAPPQKGTSPYNYFEKKIFFNGSEQWANQMVLDGHTLEGAEALGIGLNSGRPVGCVDFPPAPPPPPYALTLKSNPATLIAERVCNKNEAPSFYNKCVQTVATNNKFQASDNTFERSLIRVGYSNLISLCTSTQTTKCAKLYANSTSENTIISIDPQAGNIIYTCADAKSNNKPCIKFSADIAPGLSNDIPYRLSYEYKGTNSLTLTIPAMPTNYYNVDPIDKITRSLYGINTGMFVDLGVAYSEPFSGTADDFSTNIKYTLLNYDKYTPNSNSIINPYSLINNLNTSPLAYKVFAYIDSAYDGSTIAVYNIVEDDTKAVFINSFDRSPITDIKASQCNPCTDSANVTYTSTHTKPLMKLTIGAGELEQSAVIGIKKNCNWISEENCLSQDTPIYLHGINVNNTVTAAAKKINSYPDYISSQYHYNYEIDPSYNCITTQNTTVNINDQTIQNEYIRDALQGTFNKKINLGNYILFRFTPIADDKKYLFTTYENYFADNKDKYLSCTKSLLQKQNCPTGNEFYDCSGFNDKNNKYLVSAGYILGLEFLNQKSMINAINNQYYRGGELLCPDIKNYAALFGNNSILAKIPSGLNAPGTYQYERIIPAAQSTSALTNQSYSLERQICYSGRIAPDICNNGVLCCDSCPSNKTTQPACTNNTATDISKVINIETEGQRVKLPWEMTALPVNTASRALESLCVPIPPPTPCQAIANGGNADGFASWSVADAGKNVKGTCNAEYIGNPNRTCYPVGDNGVWGPVNSPCVERTAACIGDTSYVTPANAKASTATNGAIFFTCDPCYNSTINVSCNQGTKKWIVSGGCAPQQCTFEFTVIDGENNNNYKYYMDVGTTNKTTSNPFEVCYHSGCPNNDKEYSCVCSNGTPTSQKTGSCRWSQFCGSHPYGDYCHHIDNNEVFQEGNEKYHFQYDGFSIKREGKYCPLK